MTQLDKLIEEARKEYQEAKRKYTDLVRIRKEIQHGVYYSDQREDVSEKQ
jgi:hypothetical protein